MRTSTNQTEKSRRRIVAILACGAASATTCFVAVNLELYDRATLLTLFVCMLIPSLVGYMTGSRLVAITGIVGASIGSFIPEPRVYISWAPETDWWHIEQEHIWSSVGHIGIFSSFGAIVGIAVGTEFRRVVELRAARRINHPASESPT